MRLNVNLTSEQYKFLKKQGMSISSYIRWMINSNMQKQNISASVSRKEDK